MRILIHQIGFVFLGILLLCNIGYAEDGAPIPGDIQSYENYVDRVAGCAQLHPGDMNAIMACAGVNTQTRITIIQDGEERTIIREFNGGQSQTTITVTPVEPFVPSEMTRRLMGDDYNWSQFSNSRAEEISACLDNGQCNADSFKAAHAVTNSTSRSLEVSRCVAQRQCNIDAFLRAYAVTNSTSPSLDVSRCVNSNSCDLEAFLAAYAVTNSTSRSLEVASCVADETCSLQTFLDVYRHTNSTSRSLEVATCAGSYVCDPNVYLQYRRSNFSHREALQLAHDLYQPGSNDGEGDAGESPAIVAQ